MCTACSLTCHFHFPRGALLPVCTFMIVYLLHYLFLSFSLKGLAKPMGLVEGPGGLGQGGAAATLGEDSHDAEGKYEEYGYNAQLSDRISLDRSIPDYRPKKCVRLSFAFISCQTDPPYENLFFFFWWACAEL